MSELAIKPRDNTDYFLVNVKDILFQEQYNFNV